MACVGVSCDCSGCLNGFPVVYCFFFFFLLFFFLQAEDGIRYLVRSRGLGDVYKRQVYDTGPLARVRTVRRFDDLYTAPHNGFAGAADYYLSLIHI